MDAEPLEEEEEEDWDLRSSAFINFKVLMVSTQIKF